MTRYSTTIRCPARCSEFRSNISERMRRGRPRLSTESVRRTSASARYTLYFGTIVPLPLARELGGIQGAFNQRHWVPPLKCLPPLRLYVPNMYPNWLPSGYCVRTSSDTFGMWLYIVLSYARCTEVCLQCILHRRICGTTVRKDGLHCILPFPRNQATSVHSVTQTDTNGSEGETKSIRRVYKQKEREKERERERERERECVFI